REHARVARHVADCPACQREIQWQQQLRAAHDEAVPEYDVDAAFASMQRRLRASAAPAAQAPARKGPRQPWVAWAIAAQFIVIVGLAAALALGDRPGATYHALGSPGAAQAAGRLVVVFAPQTTEQEMRRILQHSGTRIVDGPTATGAYVVAVSPAGVEHALDTLRAERSVHLVQALDAAGSSH
ncbi:MAG: hypothetical protein WBV39_13255, partial [Rudaea sp.]